MTQDAGEGQLPDSADAESSDVNSDSSPQDWFETSEQADGTDDTVASATTTASSRRSALRRRRQSRRGASPQTVHSADSEPDVDVDAVWSEAEADARTDAEHDDKNQTSPLGESEAAEPEPASAEARTDRTAAEQRSAGVVSQLRWFAHRLSDRSPALAAAVDDYAVRVEAAARGDLPPSSAYPPGALAADVVAREISPGGVASALEVVRNALVFAPVLWTWFEIALATRAYNALLKRDETAAGESFLYLWQQSFDGAGGSLALTLTKTALVATALILALVVVHTLATLARSANNQQQERREAEFLALLVQASTVGPVMAPVTPQEQLDEFARAGISLATQLAELSASFGHRTAPLADSITAAERAMGQMAGLVRQQSEQMAEVTKSLGEVASISRRLEAVEKAMSESARALEGVHEHLAPATDQLAGAITDFRRTGDAVERAADNLTASLADSADQTTALREAADSLNAVGNRFLDRIGN